MGVAIDEYENGELNLTVQLFKPSQAVTGKGRTSKAFVNIQAHDQSLIEAVRDITIHLGRRAQWSHMRVILVSEALARKVPLLSLLDFFYRDHEPRLTSHVLVTKGRASDYLNTTPYIENSVSQQYFLSERESNELAGKTSTLSLLDLALQARSQTSVALIPYLYEQKFRNVTTPNVAGSAVFADGRVKDLIPATLMEGLLMLRGNYQSGVIEVPCEGMRVTDAPTQEDSFEVTKIHNTMKLKFNGDKPHLIFETKAYVAISELKCGQSLAIKDELKLKARVQKTIEQSMSDSMEWMLDKQVDLIGAGDVLFQKNPRLWKQWKPDWPLRFSRASYEVHANVTVLTSGTNIGKPINQN
jgi:spore germination protein KC